MAVWSSGSISAIDTTTITVFDSITGMGSAYIDVAITPTSDVAGYCANTHVVPEPPVFSGA